MYRSVTVSKLIVLLINGLTKTCVPPSNNNRLLILFWPSRIARTSLKTIIHLALTYITVYALGINFTVLAFVCFALQHAWMPRRIYMYAIFNYVYTVRTIRRHDYLVWKAARVASRRPRYRVSLHYFTKELRAFFYLWVFMCVCLCVHLFSNYPLYQSFLVVHVFLNIHFVICVCARVRIATSNGSWPCKKSLHANLSVDKSFLITGFLMSVE